MRFIDPITTNFADFGLIERCAVSEMLGIWNAHGLPEGFDDDGVHFALNRNSGMLFLANSEYQTAMMNGDKLEIWHICPQCGHEGFAEHCQLIEIDYDQYCNECKPEQEEVKE